MMQCCKRADLLRLARCCRSSYSAASHPVSWRSLSPSTVSSWLVSAGFVERFPASLWGRCCDVRFHWVAQMAQADGSGDKQPPVSAAELQLISSLPRLVDLNACSRQWIGEEHWAQLCCSFAFASLQRLTTSGDEDPRKDQRYAEWIHELPVKRLIVMLQLIARNAMPQLVQWRALGSQSNCCLTLTRESASSPQWTLELEHPSANSCQTLLVAPSLPCVAELRLSDLRFIHGSFPPLSWPLQFRHIRRAGLRRLILREACNRWEGAAMMHDMQAQLRAAVEAQDESEPPLLITGIGHAKPFAAP